MLKRIFTLAFLCAGCWSPVTGFASAPATNPVTNNDGPSSASSSVNPVIEWNRTLLVIVRTPGAQPPTIHSTRSFAMLHAAIFDAVNNIERDFEPYAVRHQTDGIEEGQDVAAAILALRANDGSATVLPPFAPKNQPGSYQLTPPNFAPADFIQWPQVTPFALARANEFRPGPPPLLTSDEYTQSFNEVKSLGLITSTSRTADQTQIGLFWNGNIQDFWNEIAQTAVLAHHLDLDESAHLFALLNISLADTTIAFFDTKYTYDLWRPVTAIQRADTDNNPDTAQDPTWIPLPTKTAPDPSFPGAHSAISAAGAEVLRLVLGDPITLDVTSESLAGVTRHFTSFSGAAEEAGLSRIYSGQHFRFDHLAGKRLGHQVARSVLSSVLQPKQEPDLID